MSRYFAYDNAPAVNGVLREVGSLNDAALIDTAGRIHFSICPTWTRLTAPAHPRQA